MLLDTCALLWLTSAPDSISARVRAEIARRPTRLHASSISAFEIGQKAARGRLSLPFDIVTWFEKVVEKHGLTMLPITSAIAGTATLLPPLHRDPFDRLLIATAQLHGLALLTPDPLIRQYSQIETFW